MLQKNGMRKKNLKKNQKQNNLVIFELILQFNKS